MADLSVKGPVGAEQNNAERQGCVDGTHALSESTVMSM
jgi:hypothetical protein